ncbi:MAG: FHIPEP family type III secretion protein, partial [Hungatella sp.]
PELVEEVFPKAISYGDFQNILSSLLKEGIPIKDMETILESISEAAVAGKDLDGMIEDIRVKLRRTITRKFCDGGQLKVIVLDAELEKSIIASLTKNNQGVYLALNPTLMQKIIAQVGEEIKKFMDLPQSPVILTSQVLRIYIYRLLEQFYPNLYVLSFNEITNNVQIQAIGNVTSS